MSRHDRQLDPFLRELSEDDPEALEDALALGEELEPATPPAELRERILSDATHEGRLHRFADRVAALLDVSTDRAREMLDGIDRADSWESAPLPGIGLYHLDGGPAVQNAITGFIRVEAGGFFPPHRHLGPEVVLVLQGHYVDEADGTEVGPGEEVSKQAETEHGLRAKPGPDLLYLAVVQDGIEMGGRILRPGDPGI
jgi:quercetin dioxygenase-like cupin family protein